jgi:uncharacterized RDD family membrane protein YckC
MYDLQKASMLKRISAALLDLILLLILVVGAALLLSTVLGYDTYSDRLNAYYDQYEEEYGVSFELSSDEYAAMPDTERERLDAAFDAFASDEEVLRVYNLLFNYTLIIMTFSIMVAYLVAEFVIPLLLGNGQTVGKKIFGIGLMREDGVKLTAIQLFARTLLGKYTVETMLPVFIVVMILFGVMGLLGTVLIGILLVVQLVLLIVTKTHTPIHDLLARTVAVDITSQLIFDTPEDLLAYKKRLHEEQVQESADDRRFV